MCFPSIACRGQVLISVGARLGLLAFFLRGRLFALFRVVWVSWAFSCGFASSRSFLCLGLLAFFLWVRLFALFLVFGSLCLFLFGGRLFALFLVFGSLGLFLLGSPLRALSCVWVSWPSFFGVAPLRALFCVLGLLAFSFGLPFRALSWVSWPLSSISSRCFGWSRLNGRPTHAPSHTTINPNSEVSAAGSWRVVLRYPSMRSAIAHVIHHIAAHINIGSRTSLVGRVSKWNKIAVIAIATALEWLTDYIGRPCE